RPEAGGHPPFLATATHGFLLGGDHGLAECAGDFVNGEERAGGDFGRRGGGHGSGPEGGDREDRGGRGKRGEAKRHGTRSRRAEGSVALLPQVAAEGCDGGHRLRRELEALEAAELFFDAALE